MGVGVAFSMRDRSNRIAVFALAAVFGCTPGRGAPGEVTAEPETLPSTAPVTASATPAPPPTALASSAPPPSASAAGPVARPIAPDAGPGKYPPRWVASFKLKSLADLPAAMAEPVMRHGEAIDLGQYPGNGKRSVTTCLDYEKATADGFGPQTTFDIAMASFFVDRCVPLRFLIDAGGSDTTYVDRLRLDVDPLGTLPATLHLNMERPSEAELQAIAKGQRLKAFDPTLVVTAKSATKVTFGHPKVDTSTVEIIAWGDADRDGVEDVLVSQSHHALEGSFQSFRHFVLTRKGAKEPLMTVREIGP